MYIFFVKKSHKLKSSLFETKKNIDYKYFGKNHEFELNIIFF